MKTYLRTPWILRLLPIVAAFVLFSTPSSAGPPFQTDDPEPVEYRHWEVYLATQWLHNRNWWYFGWLLQRELSKSLTLGAEVFYKTKDVVDGKPGSGFNVGAIVNFDEGHHLLVSAGRGIRNAEENNRFSGYLAYQWTF